MSDYRVINDNGYERTWEELYEDNVRFQKYTDKLEKENQKYKEVIDRTIKHISSLSSKGRGCEIYADVKKDILDILKEVE